MRAGSTDNSFLNTKAPHILQMSSVPASREYYTGPRNGDYYMKLVSRSSHDVNAVLGGRLPGSQPYEGIERVLEKSCFVKGTGLKPPLSVVERVP